MMSRRHGGGKMKDVYRRALFFFLALCARSRALASLASSPMVLMLADGLNICPPSLKFTQCQTVLRNSWKESPNDSLKDLWKSSSCHTNIQYDVYKSTKEVLKDFRSNQEDKLQHHLTSQGFFFSNVIKYSLSSVNSIWSEAHSHLPKNIYNFTIRCIHNSLPTRKNMAR